MGASIDCTYSFDIFIDHWRIDVINNLHYINTHTNWLIELEIEWEENERSKDSRCFPWVSRRHFYSLLKWVSLTSISVSFSDFQTAVTLVRQRPPQIVPQKARRLVLRFNRSVGRGPWSSPMWMAAFGSQPRYSCHYFNFAGKEIRSYA